jgi:hypothetical protein
MNDARPARAIIFGAIQPIHSGWLSWNRPMAILSLELSVGELSALLCAITLTLIPLTIRVFCDLESRKFAGRVRPQQKPIRQKAN